MHPRRPTALAALLLVPALALLTPSTEGPVGPLLGAVAVAAWSGTAWLLLVLALTCSSRVPGALGRTASRAARWVAPRSVRALVAAAVGGSLLLTGTAALAEDRTPTVAGSSHDSLDWPGLAPLTARPTATSTSVATPTPAAEPRPTQAPVPPAEEPRPTATVPPPVLPGAVLVAPGDSLWSLAKRSLGDDATDRQVAQAWPRWWSANRAVIGETPELIHPGDRLTAP